MNGDELQVVAMTAVEVREYLGELEAERTAAVANDLIGIDAYRHELDAEIEMWRHHFVTAAVTEMATLRAELDGANTG